MYFEKNAIVPGFAVVYFEILCAVNRKLPGAIVHRKRD